MHLVPSMVRSHELSGNTLYVRPAVPFFATAYSVWQVH